MPISSVGKTKTYIRRGVTLIEMMVVVMIIALFAAIIGPELYKKADWAKVKATQVQIQAFDGALGQYRLAIGTFPTTEQGLQALRTAPQGVSGWEGPYMKLDVPLDPWKHPYVYKFPGEHGDEPDITSYGADGQPGGDGINADIVSWKN
jgi:general secretion pathway protein G